MNSGTFQGEDLNIQGVLKDMATFAVLLQFSIFTVLENRKFCTEFYFLFIYLFYFIYLFIYLE